MSIVFYRCQHISNCSGLNSLSNFDNRNLFSLNLRLIKTAEIVSGNYKRNIPNTLFGNYDAKPLWLKFIGVPEFSQSLKVIFSFLTESIVIFYSNHSHGVHLWIVTFATCPIYISAVLCNRRQKS